MARLIQHEAYEQGTLFAWAETMKHRYPELELLHHIPNGGSRNKIEAHNLKLQGVKAGVPDISLPVPRGKYHGMYIEMKYGDNKPTANQKRWLEALKNQGYATAVCYCAGTAADLIIQYLENGVIE